MKKKVVGIVFGGRSVEHEISLISARAVIGHVDPGKFDVLPIFIEKDGRWRKANIEKWVDGGELIIEDGSLFSPSLDPAKPGLFELGEDGVSEHRVDVFFPVLHGTYGEDGAIQGLFELMGVPFVGASVLGSSVCMDKIMMKTALKESGIPVLDFVWFINSEWRESKEAREALKQKILDEIGIPCFVKAANLGSSVGISLVDDEDRLEEAVDLSCRYSNRILVEKGLVNPREIEISVLGNSSPVASVAGEIVPHREFYDYRAKYLEEGTELIVPARLSVKLAEQIRSYAIEGYRALGCSGMGRADLLIDRKENKAYLNEINTIPGFTQISMYPKLWEASGLGFEELVTRLIELALERQAESDSLETSY